jgi:hypothetical protein
MANDRAGAAAGPRRDLVERRIELPLLAEEALGGVENRPAGLISGVGALGLGVGPGGYFVSL